VSQVFAKFPLGDELRIGRGRKRARVRAIRSMEGRLGRSNGSVLLALFVDEDSVAAKVLAELGVTKEMVEAKLAEHALQSEVTEIVDRMAELDPDARRAAAARLREALARLEGEAPAS
jgi:hypothetical protein